jgi:hypothetical protein
MGGRAPHGFSFAWRWGVLAPSSHFFATVTAAFQPEPAFKVNWHGVCLVNAKRSPSGTALFYLSEAQICAKPFLL